jgi:hypothetical protein
MCRSYTLQALFAIVAVAMLSRVARKSTGRDAVLLALALLGALYTHYGGIALIATASLVLFLAALAACAPSTVLSPSLPALDWRWPLLSSWGTTPAAPVRIRVLEVPVKFAYWSMSFVMGGRSRRHLDPRRTGAPLVAVVTWRGARQSSWGG